MSEGIELVCAQSEQTSAFIMTAARSWYMHHQIGQHVMPERPDSAVSTAVALPGGSPLPLCVLSLYTLIHIIPPPTCCVNDSLWHAGSLSQTSPQACNSVTAWAAHHCQVCVWVSYSRPWVRVSQLVSQQQSTGRWSTCSSWEQLLSRWVSSCQGLGRLPGNTRQWIVVANKSDQWHLPGLLGIEHVC